MTYNVEEIYGIKNILHIALLTYSGDIIYIEPNIFKKYCTSAYNDSDDLKDLGCKGDEYSAYNSTYISYNGDKTDKSIAIDNIIDSSKKLKELLNDGIIFSISSGASHNSSKGSLVNGCTQFYNLQNLNDSNLINKGFIKFANYQHYLSLFRRDSYDWYWRVYYRTLDNYFKYLNCSEDNFKLESYNNIICKNYIDDINSSRKSEILGNTCAYNTLTDSQLWDICFPLVTTDDKLVDDSYKKKIHDRVLDYCSQSDRLLNDPKCKRFWNINYDKYFKQSDKLKYLDPIAKNLCKPGHNNYPFCYCIWNEKNPLIYIDMSGQTRRIDDSCVSELCNADAYKLSDHAEKKCPNACIQTIRANYANLKNIKLDCKLDTNSSTSNEDSFQTINNTPPINNSLPNIESPTNNLSSNTNNSSISLFHFQHVGIKDFMNKYFLKDFTPIKWGNIILTEEDIFIFFILLLLIIIIIGWKFLKFLLIKFNKKNTTDESTTDESTADESTTDESTTDESTADESTADESNKKE